MTKFLNESIKELVHHVTWPTAEELRVMTILVLVMSIFLGLLIWGMDIFWTFITSFLYGY